MSSPSKPLPSNQEAFERAVFAFSVQESIRDGTLGLDVAEIAMQQYAAATVKERRGTGVGFYTWFDVPSNIPSLPYNTILEAVYLLKGIKPIEREFAEKESVPAKYHDFGVAGMRVDIYNGYINHIDAHSYGDAKWPLDKYEFWFFENEASE